ncbi:hypothetical protein ABZU32_39145 [Sphaerisporangium sp. NPDC005288]|uniref:hypothetical protein n=1 Tax=Sphaerisporangium sp. NPDC005288 TaxID=3155114 RepID=UPI0033A266E7
MSRRPVRPARVRDAAVGGVVLSALAWWLLSLTALPASVAAWLAGVVAGLSMVPVVSAARRAVVIALSESVAESRPRRASRGA